KEYFDQQMKYHQWKFQEAILSLRVLDTDLTNRERIEILVGLMDPNDTGCIESFRFKKMIRNLADIVALESIDKEGLITEWERHLLNHVHIPADSSVNIQIGKDEIVNDLLMHPKIIELFEIGRQRCLSVCRSRTDVVLQYFSVFFYRKISRHKFLLELCGI
ncbi:unnamed protein product, partial [Didymodactylos carnosus]